MHTHKIFGIHAVQSALDYSADKISKAWVTTQKKNQKRLLLIEQLQKLSIAFEQVDSKQLDKMAGGKNHQGIVIAIALPHVHSEHELQHIISTMPEVPFFLMLDQVQDPHNLGACLRSANAFGVHGVIITKDNSAGITPTTCKVACGAAETIPVYQVTNLARTCRWLKTQNIWILGITQHAELSIFSADLTMPLVLIMGAEGVGMRKLTQQQCDVLLKIPISDKAESLNLSVAAGVMMSEVFKQRMH